MPTSLTEALAMRAERACTVVAGATDYFPALGAAQPKSDVLDITRLAALRGITRSTDGIKIGATTTWSDVIAANLPPAFDALKAAAREVGSVQIQNAGTIAGNLCNASPAADGVPPLLVLETEVEVSSERGVRRLPLEQFILGPRITALAADELVTALYVPPLLDGLTSAFEKLGSRRYLVISITMTAAVVGLAADGRIEAARVAVGACSPVACRLPELEAALIGQRPEAVVVSPEQLSPLSPIDDVRADAGYRLSAVAEQITRAIAEAAR